MLVIPFHFSYLLFLSLFPSLCRSLLVLFLSDLFAICNTGMPHVSGQGGGGRQKKNGGFPSRRSQIFCFLAPPPGLGRARKFKGKKAKGKERNKQKLQEIA